jgi:hypothetical protein
VPFPPTTTSDSGARKRCGSRPGAKSRGSDYARPLEEAATRRQSVVGPLANDRRAALVITQRHVGVSLCSSGLLTAHVTSSTNSADQPARPNSIDSIDSVDFIRNVGKPLCAPMRAWLRRVQTPLFTNDRPPRPALEPPAGLPLSVSNEAKGKRRARGGHDSRRKAGRALSAGGVALTHEGGAPAALRPAEVCSAVRLGQHDPNTHAPPLYEAWRAPPGGRSAHASSGCLPLAPTRAKQGRTARLVTATSPGDPGRQDRTSDPRGLLSDTRSPALAGRGLLLEDGGAGLVGVVGAEREFSAGVVLGPLHVELHADPAVGVAPEDHPVPGLV